MAKKFLVQSLKRVLHALTVSRNIGLKWSCLQKGKEEKKVMTEICKGAL